MGKLNTAMYSFLSDRRRFADLFNGVLFKGRKVIRAEALQETSALYSGFEGRPSERVRDIKMLLNTGKTLRILALENQNSVDYTMPCRCMQYDTMEYVRQLGELKRSNREKNRLHMPGEWLCGMRGSDRLTPVYTVCLYHGEEPWRGPLSLRDMMDFGDDSDGMSSFFADYPLRLFCVNEQTDFSLFRTELREVFEALACRRDKKRMYALMAEKQAFRRLDEETVRVLSVLLEIPGLWEERERFFTISGEKEEEYDMCQAMRELLEDARNDGISQGISQGLSRNLVNQLVQRLLAENRLEDLKRSVEDADFQEQLLMEYRLSE